MKFQDIVQYDFCDARNLNFSYYFLQIINRSFINASSFYLSDQVTYYARVKRHPLTSYYTSVPALLLPISLAARSKVSFCGRAYFLRLTLQMPN
jgi:hypothetical protein